MPENTLIDKSKHTLPQPRLGKPKDLQGRRDAPAPNHRRTGQPSLRTLYQPSLRRFQKMENPLSTPVKLVR